MATSADGTVLASRRAATPHGGGIDAIVDAIGVLVGALVPGGLLPVGVVVPGIVDEQAGIARLSANLGWRNAPLPALPEDRLGARVVLGHDARAGALGKVLANLQTTLDLDLIVLGGGLSAAGASLLEPLAKAVRTRLTFQRMPAMVTANLGDKAGCLGAALLASANLAASGSDARR